MGPNHIRKILRAHLGAALGTRGHPRQLRPSPHPHRPPQRRTSPNPLRWGSGRPPTPGAWASAPSLRKRPPPPSAAQPIPSGRPPSSALRTSGPAHRRFPRTRPRFPQHGVRTASPRVKEVHRRKEGERSLPVGERGGETSRDRMDRVKAFSRFGNT